jgi:hypothetical protein
MQSLDTAKAGATGQRRGCLLTRRSGAVALTAVNYGATCPASDGREADRRDDAHQHQAAVTGGRELDAAPPATSSDAGARRASGLAFVGTQPTRIRANGWA